MPPPPDKPAVAGRRPAAGAFVALVGGLFFQYQFPLPAVVLAAGAFILIAVAVMARRTGGPNNALAFTALALAGAAWFAGRRDFLPADDLYFYLHGRYHPVRGALTGFVVNDAERRAAATTFVVRAEKFTFADTGRTVNVSGKVRVTVYDDDVPVRYGDRVKVRGKFHRPKPARNPGAFNYRRFLWSRGVTTLGNAEDAADVKILSRGRGNPFARASFAVKRFAAASMDKTVGGEEAKLLKALTLGTREEMDPEVLEDFRAAGVAHLLAVSGFNVGVVAFVLFLIVRGTRLPRPAANLVTLAFLPAYAFLTGGDPPVVRAAVMGALALLADLLARDVDFLNLLAAAAVLILAFNPLLVTDAAFLLSFGACLGLGLFYVPATRLLRRLPPVLNKPLAATAAAQITILPLQIYFFHRFPVVAFASNLIMVPLASVATILALLTLVASALWGALGDLYGAAAWLVAKTLLTLSGFFAAGFSPLLKTTAANAIPDALKPYADLQFWVRQPSVGFLTFVSAAAALPLARKWRSRVAVLAVAVAGGSWWFVNKFCSPPADLKITVLDVGQADSIFIEFPDGKTMLVDAGYAGGTYDAGTAAIGPFLHSRGRTRLDYLCLTHWDADHAGGARYLIENFAVGQLWLPFSENGAHPALVKNIKKTAANRGTVIRTPPDRLNVGGVTVYRVWPPPGGAPVSFSQNNSSTVLLLVYKNFGALLTADAEKEALEKILAANATVRADFLKAPHHGSADAAVPAFIAAVKPRAVAFTCKAGAPRFPAPETLALYRQAGAKTLLTGENGAAVATTDGRRLLVRTTF